MAFLENHVIKHQDNEAQPTTNYEISLYSDVSNSYNEYKFNSFTSKLQSLTIKISNLSIKQHLLAKGFLLQFDNRGSIYLLEVLQVLIQY